MARIHILGYLLLAGIVAGAGYTGCPEAIQRMLEAAVWAGIGLASWLLLRKETHALVGIHPHLSEAASADAARRVWHAILFIVMGMAIGFALRDAVSGGLVPLLDWGRAVAQHAAQGSSPARM